MIIAGLQKNSFIDFPGKISCVLFTTGCNFVCPYCHNADLARGEYPARFQSTEVIAFLKSRRGMLDGVAITGGEPTLADGIVDLCRAVKSLGYPVKLDTNGSRPGVLRKLLDQQLVDFVAMDIKAPLDSYGPFCPDPKIRERLTATIRLIMESAPDYEFRTTCAKPFVDQVCVERIAKTIEGAARYVLQPFNRRAECLDPAFNRHQDPTIFPDEMQRLKQLAAPFVGHCMIR
ncbi:anaerobic ribonucleoside-triphosphate reductase activating protein [Desulfosarcina alkanivorans]|uniref:Anaerobic ribonucleoside-triphosphate reductase activating protein n=1 Tax=Desulfosarcina alkanivorans TaxID=571177 RepID=A0A5K7YZK4_9BACT|nr:anaerobic ribonucleoside-triphosphate reductase activating protein [Desulfosarcina alkanivorans]BBO71684.1 anaerobic ribonucleoside-triphosphate reductase activating protein [Desulfosarcina alkanivorans]